MKVIYHNRKKNLEGEKETNATYVDFETLLIESDFIAIAAPLNDKSKGKFGVDEFRKMKPTSIIVNVGRGMIIKESELVEALKRGEIFGAGLDVFENEPEINEKLLKQKNTVLLPHIGSATYETRIQMTDMAVASVEMALSNKTPAYLVNIIDNPIETF